MKGVLHVQGSNWKHIDLSKGCRNCPHERKEHDQRNGRRKKAISPNVLIISHERSLSASALALSILDMNAEWTMYIYTF